MGRPKKSTMGQIAYIPPEFRVELDDIMVHEELHSKSEGFRKMAKYSRLGREAKKAGINWDFPKVDEQFNRKKKKSMW